jgi:hypothetical protein
VLTYVAFLVGGKFIDRCIVNLPAHTVFQRLTGWMRQHPQMGDKEWVESLDDAAAALNLCEAR